MTAAAPDGFGIPDGFGVYVHWPFCLSKCPYCDFNSHVRERVDQEAWRDGLLAELAAGAAETPGRVVTSVFFGGGTPSLMPPATVAAVLQAVQRHWVVAPDAEVTLEANPTSAEAGRFAGFAAAGVNRISLGVQALDDAALRFLGREHDAGQARRAVALARAAVPRLSLDLIYARPGQSVAAWEAELDQALDLAGDHLSVYQLTIEEGTAFHGAARRGELTVPDAELGADLFEATRARLSAAGLPAYEVSNHARPGAECRHNLTYWRYEEFLGIGPGAHGRHRAADGVRYAVRRHRAPEIWLARTAALGHGTRQRDPVPDAVAAEEALLMGLRLAEGIDAARFRRLTGTPLELALDAARLAALTEEGLVTYDGTALRATEAGMLRLNAVIAYLVP